MEDNLNYIMSFILKAGIAGGVILGNSLFIIWIIYIIGSTSNDFIVFLLE